MKADLGRLVRFNEQRAGDPELAIAHERGWRDYRTIKSFIYSERCRRRSVLDHFGDREAGRPLERCCDVCDPQGWLPDPETIAVRRTPSAKKAAAPPAELSAGRRAALRGAEGVAPARRRRQTRLHRRPQHDPGGDRRHPPGRRGRPARDQRRRPQLRRQVRPRSAGDRRAAGEPRRARRRVSACSARPGSIAGRCCAARAPR